MERKIKDSIINALIFLSAIITIGILFWILSYILMRGIKYINIDFIVGVEGEEASGLIPMFASTFYMVVLSIGISSPIGICTALYLTEYAKNGSFVRLVRFTTECLSGIPSIIYGLFGMIFMVVVLKMGFSIMAGAITLSIMVLPTVIRTSEEALKSVAKEYREGSLALGASKLQTIVKVVLPSAIPGILTAVILSTGRVVGETAAVYLTAGMVDRIPSSLMDSGRTLSVHLYLLAKEGISFEKSYATAAFLIIIVFALNLSSNFIAKKLNRV